MLDAVRTALRLKNTKFDDEIKNLINACLIDLGLGGMSEKVAEDDAIVLQAVILYCKGHFGFDDDNEKYCDMYENLKIAIANSGKYGDNGDDD